MLETKEKLPRQCALCSMGKLLPNPTHSAAHFPWKKHDNTGDIPTGLAGVLCWCPRYQRLLEDYTWAAKLLLAHLLVQSWAAWRSEPFPHPWTVTGVLWYEKGAAIPPDQSQGNWQVLEWLWCSQANCFRSAWPQLLLWQPFSFLHCLTCHRLIFGVQK